MAEKEYIEREAAIAVIYGQHVGGKEACENARPNTYGADLREIVADIEDIPAADVRPVVKAKIVDMRYAEDDGEWKCTRCGWQYTLCVCGKDVTSKIRYCPNCGADMRETNDEKA